MNKDVRKALELIVSELSNGELVLTYVVKEAKDEVAEKRASKKDKKVEPKEEVKEDDAVETAEYSMEELKAMTQAELKALAKELGVSVRGSKSAILGRILEKIDVAEVEEEEEPVEEAEEPVTEEVENDDAVQEALEELELEDLADLCEQAELSTKGKKQALIARLMTAHNAGEIDLTDFFEEEDITDEVDEEIEEDAVDEMQIEEILEAQDLKTVKAVAKKLKIKVALKDKKPAIIEKIGQYNVEDVIEVLNDMGLIESADDEEESEGVEMPKFEGSKKRIKACEACWKETMADLENGDIDEDDIREFFEDRFSGNKSELKKIAKKDWEDLAIEFAEIIANMFDDDGDDVEMQEPYMVGETPYCCGVPMKKVDDTHFLCEVDGEEVELEDEE